MTDPSEIIAPSAAELEAFYEACFRCGQHFAETLRQREYELIRELLQGQQQEGQADV
jgi:hypothetical protein